MTPPFKRVKRVEIRRNKNVTENFEGHASLEIEESRRSIPQLVKLLNIDAHSLIYN